jgi:hypothetical protein
VIMLAVHRPFGDIPPEVLLAAAGAASTFTNSLQDLVKNGLTLHIEHNVRLPSSGEMLTKALPPAILTTAFVTATVFLISAGFRFARRRHEPRASKLRAEGALGRRSKC